MRNCRQAHIKIAESVSVQAKHDKINATTMPYKARLAAILASDTRPGKVW